MREMAYTIGIFLLLASILLAAGCTAPGETPPPVKPPIACSAQGLPREVPGFSLELCQDNTTTLFGQEEYFAAVFFKPQPDSSYNGTIDYLTVTIDRFRNATDAAALMAEDKGEELKVGGMPGRYSFDQENGLVSVRLVKDRSFYEASAHAVPNLTLADEAVLKKAALAGITATLSSG